jgi:S1-C subfamily serine protease
MRFHFPMLLSVGLAACVTPSAVLVNDHYRVVDCRAAGFGIISGTMAQNRFETCVSTAQMSGFVRAERAGVTGILSQDGDGVFVARVLPGSPASREGLVVGDKVVAVSGQRVSSATEANALLFGDPGSRVTLTVLADGQEKTITLVRVAFSTLVGSR